MNKYLEKVAAWGGILGGIDRAVGSVSGSVSKAFKPMKTLGPEDAIRKTITQKNTLGQTVHEGTGINKDVIKNLRSNLNAHTMGPGGSSLGANPTQARREVTDHLRKQLGMQKDHSHRQITRDANGKITKITNQYSTKMHPDFKPGQPNPFLKHLDDKTAKNSIHNRAIYTARAKVGAGALAIAGAGTLGYNKGKSSNDVYGGYPQQQSPQYY